VDLFRPLAAVPAATENTANLMLGYEKGRISFRIATTYRDACLDELGDDADEDRWVKDHIQLDLSAKVRVTNRFQVLA
jgi:hypothetical protein